MKRWRICVNAGLETAWILAGKVIRELGPTVIRTCIVGPAIGRAVGSVLPPKPIGLARLAGVRALAVRSVDGAVLEGGSVQAGAKFAIPKGLPTEPGERRLIIENEPHTVDGFNGVIPEGYGKGTKTLLYHGPVIVKVGGKTSVQTADYHHHDADRAGPHFDLAVTGVPSQQFSMRPKQWEINFFQGPLAGRRYSIVNTIMREGTGGRMAIQMKDRGLVLSKPDIRMKDREWLSKQSQNDWIAEWKPDGSMSGVSLSADRAAFRSHRWTGKTYYDKLPGLEFLRNQSRLWTCRRIFPDPGLNGTLLKGELLHPDGAGKMSGILNSHPDRARAYQEKNGDAEFHTWDIVRYKGRDVSDWDYTRRRGLLEAVVGEIRRYNKNWHVVKKSAPGESPVHFYDRVISDRRGLPYSEGVVVKDRRSPESWFKIKASEDIDLPVLGFVEGTGKYAGSVGAIKVWNPETQQAGEVGSLAVSDADRQWLFDNRAGLKGGVARIQAMRLTERGVPRAGIFLGMHESKGSEEALAVLAAREV